MLSRHVIRNIRITDLVLRPHQPFRHRLLGHEKCPGDLDCFQPGHGAKRQRYLRLASKCRMTAGKDEPQSIVYQEFLRGLSVWRARRCLLDLQEELKQLLFAPERLIAPKPVDRPATSGGEEPSVGPVRHAILGPACQSHDESILERVFSELKVAATSADERRCDSRLSA